MFKLFLFLFYNSVKLLVKVSFRIFYSKIVVKNKNRLQTEDPCILVSNHPSTLTDPLQVATQASRITHFLANASMFKSKFGNWFFSTFYCIPVERPKDVNGRRISNDDAFEKAETFLQGGGLLYIAAEGYSQPERRLGRIKTGTARIALSTESKSDFNLGLIIQPVGLNYTNHRIFRSQLFTYVGEPIKVADYKSIYEKQPREAVKQLTEDIATEMKRLIIDTEDTAEDELLHQLETLLRNSLPMDLEAHYFRNKKLLNQLRTYRDNFPTDDKKFREKVQSYFNTLNKSDLADRPIAQTELGKNKSLLLQGLLRILGFPFFAYGWINNILANYIPLLVTKKVNIFPGYDSTIKLLTGLITYPLIYGLQVFLIHQLFNNWKITLVYLVTLLPFGWFALSWQKKYKQFLENKKWKGFNTAGVLKKERKEIMETLTEKILPAQNLIA